MLSWSMTMNLDCSGYSDQTFRVFVMKYIFLCPRSEEDPMTCEAFINALTSGFWIRVTRAAIRSGRGW